MVSNPIDKNLLVPPTRGIRFENIDALRGVAALLVLWLHVAEVFVVLPNIAARGTAWYDAADLLGVGRMGVIAFFAISGYVVVPTVRGPRLQGTVAFLIKRAYRLFPPFWFAVAVAALTVWWLFDHRLTWSIVAANLTMIPIEFGQLQMMGQFWTLEVELIFYTFLLILFWANALHDERVIAWALLAIAVVWAVLFRSALGRLVVDRNLVWSYLGYFLSVMFWGAMLRRRHHGPVAERAWSVKGDWPFVLVTSLVFGRPVIAILFGSPFVHRDDWNGTLLGLLAFIGFVRLPAWVARPFAWLGTISYSLYLLHPAVFYPFFYVVSHHPDLATGPLWIYIVSSILASVVFAAFAYLVIERPSIAAGRELVGRLKLETRSKSDAGV